MDDHSERVIHAQDERGNMREVLLADEKPLALHVNDKLCVTLLTLGAFPQALAIGYLCNQRLLREKNEIADIELREDSVFIRTHTSFTPPSPSSGCGVGSAFASSLDEIKPFDLSAHVKLTSSALGSILQQVNACEMLYKKTGAVHGCALATNHGTQSEIIYFVEDVGRHNAVDTIAGLMWESGVTGADKVFYTTGRLSSEIVLKVAHMGIPFLVSRSMITQRGFDIADQLNMTVIARARRNGYLLFGKQGRFQRDDEAHADQH